MISTIDLGTPTDNLPLFNCCQLIKTKKKESFSFIFNDNLDFLRHLFNTGKMRPVTYNNIQMTILCGSIYLGWDFYECPICHEETIVPHSCHSRFCTKCGAKETKQRAAYVSSMTLHTFGRDLKWNPHLCCLVCEEGYDSKNNKMKN